MKNILKLALATTMLMPAAALAQDAVEVTLWHMEQPPHRVARVQELIDAFNAANPGIVVKQEPQNWGEVYAKTPAALAAGQGPDMLFAIPDFTPILKDIGALTSVEDFVKELDEKHDFVDSTVEAYSYDGGVWAVPLYNMAMNLWYRKSVLEAAGVEVPTTWDEWRAAAEKLSVDGVSGMGLPANKQLYTDQTVYSVMVNGGATEIYNEDGTLRFDNPETVGAYEFYTDLHQFSPADSTSWTWGEAEACFSSQTCAMVMQFSVIATYDTQAEGDASDLGVAAIPSKDGGEHNTISYANAVMLLSTDEAKMEASKKFVSFLLEPENYGRFLNMEPGLFMPVTADGAEAETFWSDPMVEKYREQIETVIENSQNGRLFGFTSGRTFPSIAAISAQNIIAETLQSIVVSGQSAAEAVAAGQARMEEVAQ
ncbi:sugar ABC transporter substrate-binding protein [Mesorhizobium microcysteis]|uniref:Sugar ABC transporter substrate-binding protein n=1 Tax=Neoaquamicrobium microcysteis TaxID=2682781 RepID=A0A5D4GTG5_9HYPH|nr:sugar ABC transporter substrate-binding protein [Mesorhizobium microcysteis]TYR30565.1 sugar ABC transporter substrate-binding protein [Mesorhizobium microcysteis]